jgi:hypothetical protein
MSGEKTNFLFGCMPNWIDLEETTLTAGGEVAGSEVDNLKTQDLADTWRTPNLFPHRTRVAVDYGETERPSAGAFVGNFNLKGAGNYFRLRRGEDVSDVRLWPAYNDGVHADVLLPTDGRPDPINVTGSPSSLHEDPLSAITTWVTPTDPDFTGDMNFSVALQTPRSPLAMGPFLQAILVAWQPVDVAVVGSLTLKLWQNGVDQGIGVAQTGLIGGEAGPHVLELKFDAADLDDPSGAGLSLSIYSSAMFPGLDGLHEIGGVVWHATLANREHRSTAGQTGLEPEAVNANGNGSPHGGAAVGQNPFDPPAGDTIGVEPLTATAVWSVRWRLVEDAVVGLLATGASRQTVAVRCDRGGSPGTGVPTARVELWQNGVYQNVFVERTISTNGNHYMAATFDAADLDDPTGANMEVRFIGTPDGDTFARLYSLMWFALTTEDAYEYDSGYLELDPALTAPGVAIPGGVGKPSIVSLPLVYPQNESGEVVHLAGRHLVIEFYARSAYVATGFAGVLEFTNEGGTDGVDFLDVGRLAEGPALSGMKLDGGFSMEVVDPSLIEENDLGIIWSDDEATYRIFTFRLINLPKTLALSSFFDYLMRRHGHTRDVLLIIFPEDADFRRVAHCWGPLRTTKLDHDHGTIFRADLKVRERL